MITWVGVDPDINKSGIAVIKSGCILDLKCLDFFDLLNYLNAIKFNSMGPTFKFQIVIENGGLIKKSNWRRGSIDSVRERIAANVGQNHAVSKLLVQFCTKFNYPFKEVKPRGKLTHQEFVAITSTYPPFPVNSKHGLAHMSGKSIKHKVLLKRTNQEVRDACMLVWYDSLKS
jgi:hypothetical protein